ncbi:iron complex transport system substrate-binding protein [Crossiella equi]|uniref:Iron complex transport system substrate-binding protein n=1 Tax=Crossiella equi TaxID=130796 RepID=A0ABS5AF26_9PSEU|nr:iron-siderophore ABC transporter substrate-binding protein [Crossiella equi]MBP2475193.1 iron complex transport system substrate-binding protein [Crossiella equi]
MLATLTAATLLLVTACGGGGTPSSSTSAGESAAGFPRTVEHAMGKTTIERQPTKVAALDSSYVDAVLALETQLAAYTLFPATGERFPDYLKAEAEKYAKNAKPVGELEQTKIEQVLVSDPDLILSAKVRHESLYSVLSARKPTVFSAETGKTWKDNIRLAAKALGKEQLAETKIKAYEDRARGLGEAIKAKAGRTPTVSVVRFVNGPTRAYSRNSFIGIVLADVGVARPAEQADPNAPAIFVELSEENILRADADHVFVTAFPDPKGDSAKAKQKFQANPLWTRLTGQVHDVSDTTWISSVSLQGAQAVLADLAKAFGVTVPA